MPSKYMIFVIFQSIACTTTIVEETSLPDEIEVAGADDVVVPNPFEQYTPLIIRIKKSTETFDGTPQSVLPALNAMHNAVGTTFAELLITTESLCNIFYSLTGTVDGAITDTNIGLQQVIQSVMLAAITYPYVAYHGLEVTINMATQDLANILSTLIYHILEVTKTVADSDQRIEAAESLHALLQTVISVAELITETASRMLKTIDCGSILRLDTLVQALVDANEKVAETLHIDESAASMDAINSSLTELEAELTAIFVDQSVHTYGSVEITAGGMTDVLKRYVDAIHEVDGDASDATVTDSLAAVQREVLSLKTDISELFEKTSWSPNNSDVSFVNTLSAIEGIIERLTDVAYEMYDTHNVANTLNDQLVILANTLNNLIMSVSRAVAVTLSSLIRSEKLATEMRPLAALLYGVAHKLQGLIDITFIAVERFINSILSATKLTWTEADAVEMAELLNVLQFLTGMKVNKTPEIDFNIPRGVVALAEVATNAANLPELITQSVYSIQSLIDEGGAVKNDE